MKIPISILFIIFAAAPLCAQSDFLVFAQVADGAFNDGTSYRSTLMVQSLPSSSPTTCTFRLYGVTATFGGLSGPALALTIPSNGWLQTKSTGVQAFQGGYATLTCSSPVFANLSYAYYAGNTKLGEATVFGVRPALQFRLIADQTEGGRLGVAIANDTDGRRDYVLTLTRSDGSFFASAPVQVPARSSVAKFVDELLPSSQNQILEATITSPLSSSFSAVGLRFTGSVFTTIPAN